MTATDWAVDGDEWVTVLEFARACGGATFLFAQVEDLIAHLREWHPSGLWHPDRYAIQLQIPARHPHQAVQWALAYHRAAAQTVSLPASVLVRLEVLTIDELRRSWDENPGAAPGALSAPHELLCNEVYVATRRLLAAATPEELTEILAGFVTLIGGLVEPGPPRYLPGTAEIDLSLDGEEACHARADAISVAGLMIEHLLPSLVTDARRASARLHARRAQA